MHTKYKSKARITKTKKIPNTKITRNKLKEKENKKGMNIKVLITHKTRPR